MTRTEIELGGQARAAEVAATLLKVRQGLAARYWMDYPYMRGLVLEHEYSLRDGGLRHMPTPHELNGGTLCPGC